MAISLNNQTSVSNMLTFTDVPNILKITGGGGGGHCVFTFTFANNLQSTVTANSQYYVSFLNESVANTLSVENANNKRFYISNNASSTAASFAYALRCCQSLAADFEIMHNGDSVNLVAKTSGSKLGNVGYYSTNIPQNYLRASGQDGSSGTLGSARINVDVLRDSGVYVTTLTKMFYGNDVMFDISPVISTFAEYGRTRPYTLRVASYTGGEYSTIGQISARVTKGYSVNQSDKYKMISGAQILINNNRDEDMKFYTYERTVPFTVLSLQASSSGQFKCLDSSLRTLYTGSFSVSTDTSLSMKDTSITIPTQYYSRTYYVDITMNNNTIRFDVIKPLKATEYFQRVYWRNEYGGISFFDFTGQRSESDSVDIGTYEKNVYDFYDVNYYERKIIYENDYKKTVTLTSHLLDENGKYIFNSLMKSKKVWTVINNMTYYIAPTSIDVQESNEYNGVYTAKLSYEYSDI